MSSFIGVISHHYYMFKIYRFLIVDAPSCTLSVSVPAELGGRWNIDTISPSKTSELQWTVERLYKTRQHFMYCAITDTTEPGKLGRAVGFSTRASRAGVDF